MRNIIFLPLIFLLIFACTSNDTKIDVKESESHYQLGLEFAQLSLFKNALEEFDLAIKFNPENSNIYRKKGLVLFGMNQYNDAKLNFEKAISLNPQDTQAHINLGIIYNNIGDYEKSSINHQFALRYAIQMSSVAGQSVAIGNLGKVGGNNVYAQMN